MLVTLSHFFRLVPHVPVDNPLIDALGCQDAGEGMAERVESWNVTPLVVFGKGSVEVIGRLALGDWPCDRQVSVWQSVCRPRR